ncbi:MAG: HAMP domain-containing sensor histidine kinase [Candidatus Krumholzibacteriota bacterium]|nr:HAMP domain-containing sensor histidine kinase [Candidatus Krumholzibacteriota bacterium]
MMFDLYTHILERIRRLSPKTIDSLLSILDSEFKDHYRGIYACAIDIPSKNVIYLSNAISGIDESDIRPILRLEKQDNYRLEVINKKHSNKNKMTSIGAVNIPLYHENECFGHFSMLISDLDSTQFNDRKNKLLSEILSLLVVQFILPSSRNIIKNESDFLRRRLFRGLKDSSIMRSTLMRMMDLSGAEYCAFCSEDAGRNVHIMLDGKELNSEVPDITNKVVSAFAKVADSGRDSSEYSEKVYYRTVRSNIKYLVGKTSIKSYFLAPVTRDSSIRGIVFFGSFRKRAFTANDISYFKDMGGTRCNTETVLYSGGGEAESLKDIINILPFGTALVSENGDISYNNPKFRKILKMGDADYRSVADIYRLTGYNFQDLCDELKIFRDRINDRKIVSAKSDKEVLIVNWISIKGISREFDSILMIDYAEKESNFDKKMLSIIAHEIRTPISALKNSLKILSQEESVSSRELTGKSVNVSREKFFETALRTADRLNLIVDGLVDVFSEGIKANSLKIERAKARSFIESATHIFKGPLDKKGITLSINIDDNVSDIEVDLHKMEQIIQNLLSNSCKNVPAGGKIELSVLPVSPPSDTLISALPWEYISSPQIIDVCVKDSGRGFPPDVIKNVNSMAVDYLERKRRTIGLGLYISGTLARLHGGILRIGNNDNGGSSSHVYLPADLKSRTVMKTVFSIDNMIREMIKKGDTPILYILTKKDTKCWFDLIGMWNKYPSVYPDETKGLNADIFTWPLWERCAFVLASERIYLSDPKELFSGNKNGSGYANCNWEERVRIGWGISFHEGGNTRELIMSAKEKLENLQEIPV